MSDPVAEWGVVGAGGAGFPTDVKLRGKAEVAIVNAAECEPLLHKDKELILHEAEAMLAGLSLVMERTGASRGVVGVKEKYEDVMSSLRPRLPAGVSIHPLSDTYPAGDEFLLVFDVTKRVVPPGGLPKDVGAIVHNVETLVNLGKARPVTRKALTVAGAVAHPRTLRVPVGITFREVIEAAGGATVSPFATLVGGAMMGRLAASLDEPVTKTTGGLILLPADHGLVARYRRDWNAIARIGRSSCDQCSFCTEICPRYLLGHPIEPHRAMRALGFLATREPEVAGTLYCCECNVCSLVACPEALDPKNVCVEFKKEARKKGLAVEGPFLGPHPLQSSRRVPMKRLIRRLGLTGFVNEGPWVREEVVTRRVVLPLKQHAGAPAVAVVRAGERVRAGDPVARPAEGALGAVIHASIEGTVRMVDTSVVIEA